MRINLILTLCATSLFHTQAFAHGYSHSFTIPLDVNYWKSNSKASIGLSYEFRPIPVIGINLWGDYTSGKQLETFLGGGLAYHTAWIQDLRFIVMPGYRAIYQNKYITYRTGIAYETSFSKYLLTGTHLFYDLSPEKPGILFGFTVGFGL